MSYKVRNTLVLLVLLVIVIIASIAVNSDNRRTLSTLNKEYENITKNYEQLQKIIARAKSEEEMKDILRELKEEAIRISKVIPKYNDPTQTYQYLIQISELYAPDVIFDFRVMKGGSEKETSYNEYSITGISPFESLYNFISQIENQPLLYTIESLSITGAASQDPELVAFSLTIRAYYDSNNGTEVDEIPLQNLIIPLVQSDPFYPRIHSPRQEPQTGLLDIDNITIIGLSPDMVFAQDSQGRLHVLKLGDRVSFGYLKDIDWENQAAVFSINKLGIPKDEILYMYKVEQ
jgi:Tfp pilus assembly protein PilO